MKIALPLALLSAITFCTSESSLAQTTRFDVPTSTLQISCVALYENGAPSLADGKVQTFAVELRMDGEKLIPASIHESVNTGSCSGRFDTATGLYTDLGRLGDEAYSIELHLGQDGLFSLSGATHAGHADTSLWRVSKNGRELYLAGAIHILTAFDLPAPAVYESAYQRADIVVTEVVISELEETNDTASLFRSDNGTLSSDLSPSTYLRLSEYLSPYVPVSALEHYLPTYVSLIIESIALAKLGYTEQGIDIIFGARAEEENKPVLGLETAQMQLDLILGNQGQSTESLIVETLNSVEQTSLGEELRMMVRAWREGDTAQLNTVYLVPMQLFAPEYYDLLIVQRNQAWIPQLEQMLDTDEVELVLVGVLHLVGEHSVIAMLEAAGFTVERY